MRYPVSSLLVLCCTFFSCSSGPKSILEGTPYEKCKEEKTTSFQDVCFSPEGRCDIKLMSFLKTAQQSVDIAVYDFQSRDIAQSLIELSGVIKVRLIADRAQAKGKLSQIPRLFKASIPVKFGKQPGDMKNIFVIVDNKFLITGSFNFNKPSIQFNNENQLFTDNSQLVSLYMERYEQLWESGNKALFK